MFRKLIATAALALLSSAAHAQAVEYNFTYTGFFDNISGQFNPTAQIAGRFTADDRNGNGVFERQELLSLYHHDSYDYLGCGVGNMYWWQCTVDSFSYKPGESLNFSTTWSQGDMAYSVTSRTTTGQDYVYTYRSHWLGDDDTHYLWTDQTVFKISPVPEPASAAMLALGLLGLGGARLRARVKARRKMAGDAPAP